jgi:hypothetical protein
MVLYYNNVYDINVIMCHKSLYEYHDVTLLEESKRYTVIYLNCTV